MILVKKNYPQMNFNKEELPCDEFWGQEQQFTKCSIF